MKTKIICTFLVVVVTACLLAQGALDGLSGNDWRKFRSPYKPTTPPPLKLSEAYTLTLDRIGAATNRFYCVKANCLEMTKRKLPGWTFWFSNTNGEQAYVEVSFDKEVEMDNHSAELFRKTN